DNSSGLTTILHSDAGSLADALQPTDEEALRVLPAGPIPPNPAELLGSQKMRSIIEMLQLDADIVVFDSPPVRAVTDAAVLAPIVDATLLVIDSGHTRRATVRQGREALVRVGARLIGATLNRVASSEAEGYYGHVEPELGTTGTDPVAIATARGHTQAQGRHAPPF